MYRLTMFACACSAVSACLCSALGCASADPIVQPPSPVPFERHWATTSDNWKLSLYHYPPIQPRPDCVPVILCHGNGNNNRFWDLNPELSLAGHLSRLGFDVWSLSLRGAGESDKPAMESLRALYSLWPAHTAKELDVLLGPADWCIDDYIEKDLPAAVDYVKKTTGSAQVAWMGHSVGGMTLLGAMERHPRDDIATAVIVGSPLVLPQPVNCAVALFDRHETVVRVVNTVVTTKPMALWGSFLGDRCPHPIDCLYFNMENTDPATIVAVNRFATENLPPGVLSQLVRFVRCGRFQSLDGKYDYSAHVESLRTPMLFLAGRVDNQASPESVAYAHRRLMTSDRKFVELSPVNGTRHEYGHSDMILGRYAPVEVWPQIVDWLAGHCKVEKK